MPEPLSPLFEELYLKEGMELAMDKALEMTGESDLVVDTGLPWYTTVNGYAYLCGSSTIDWGITEGPWRDFCPPFSAARRSARPLGAPS
jgi:hypothetical protein